MSCPLFFVTSASIVEPTTSRAVISILMVFFTLFWLHKTMIPGILFLYTSAVSRYIWTCHFFFLHSRIFLRNSQDLLFCCNLCIHTRIYRLIKTNYLFYPNSKSVSLDVIFLCNNENKTFSQRPIISRFFIRNKW